MVSPELIADAWAKIDWYFTGVEIVRSDDRPGPGHHAVAAHFALR